MDSEKNRKDFNAAKSRHFAKLHERIQNKYNEMQRKLEKSKSVDSLTTADDYNLYKDNPKYSSTSDLTDDVFVENGSNDGEERLYPLMHTVIVEDVNKIEVTYTSIDPEEVSFSESETSNTQHPELPSPTDAKSDNTDKDNSGRTLSDDIKDWIMPHDLLLQLDTKGDESTSTSANPRLSLRNKIGSRIEAVRERRRESKEKKLLQKKLEKESRESIGRKSEILESKDKLLFSSSTRSELRLKDRRFKLATVTIALIEVTGLHIDLTEERRSLQCRFKLGIEKYKTKHIRHVATRTVKWQELFSMSMYDEYNNLLEISLLDTERKDMVIGKTTVDLSELEREKTHVMKLPLEGIMGNAQLFALLTISGTPFDDLLIGLENYNEYQTGLELEDDNFRYFRLDDFSKVGRLSVLVHGAKGLASPDCYCTLKLINERRQTHTEYKTNEPNWMKSFSFNVTDITSLLEVTVRDERRDEEVGRLIIPLLQISNGEKVWYALKDETLRERARGHNARILLEMKLSWNIIKASVKVIKPKEVDFLESDEKFDRKMFFKNIARSKPVVYWTLDFLYLLKSCFEWESRKLNTIWLILWLLFNWYFSPWMVPLLLLIPFAWYKPENISWNRYTMRTQGLDKEHRKSIWQKINNLPDLIFTVQRFLSKLASFGESVKNLFNFTVPYLSFLAIFFLVSISITIYLIPVNYIFMGWGIKKYVRKIIWPNRIPHSEVLDLISRVPDDEKLIDCELLPVVESTSKTDSIDKDEADLFDDILLCDEEDQKLVQNFEGI